MSPARSRSRASSSSHSSRVPLPSGRLTKRARRARHVGHGLAAAADCPAPPSGPGCAARSRSACAAPAAAAAGRCAASALPSAAAAASCGSRPRVQRPAFRAAIASTLPQKRMSRCSRGLAARRSSRSSDRPSSWLANRVSTCAASSKATAKARSRSACSASICGASRACACRSAHSSFSPKRRQPRVLARSQTISGWPSFGFPAPQLAPHVAVRQAQLARGAGDGALLLHGVQQVHERIADPARPAAPRRRRTRVPLSAWAEYGRGAAVQPGAMHGAS